MPSTDRHTDPTALHCLLYRSQIAPQADLRCIADIVKRARRFNPTQNISGLLVFDGNYFCQYLEGSPSALNGLIRQIEVDPRHIEFEMLHHHPLEGTRRFTNWSMAYCVVDEEEYLSTFSFLQGPAALRKFEEIMPLLDIA